jgi:GTP-binding protein
LNELARFNPEMLDKQRVLAITKSDMLDEELMEMLEVGLPDNVPHIFISSVTGMGIQQLKDILWTELNKESNKLGGASTESIVHRAKDVLKLQQELKDMGEDEVFEFEYEDEDDDFEYEYEEEDWDEEDL